MNKKNIICPKCQTKIPIYNNPAPTIDTLIYLENSEIILINRAIPPFGWALPGGFIDYGETVEKAAIRESQEETGLNVTLQGLIGVYSDPSRDLRRHTITTAFWATATNLSDLKGGDDAAEAKIFNLNALPDNIVFWHDLIIADFINNILPKLKLNSNLN